MKKFSFILLAAIGMTISATAQDLKLPALSPTCKIVQEFSTSNIEINYSRPSLRGRKVFGDLVGYDRPWRTGANAQTKIKFGEDVEINGKAVKAGEYAFYSIPGATEWTIIFNKANSTFGPNGYDTADDVARFRVKPRALDKDVHTLTINIGNITLNSCNIELMWEKTKIVIPVKANNEQRLSTAIDKAINNPNIPYFQAANYYNETNQHLDLAYTYVTKAVDANPKAFYMWQLKAKIALKLGKKQETIAAAKQSMETAKGAALEADYLHIGQQLIDAANKL